MIKTVSITYFFLQIIRDQNSYDDYGELAKLFNVYDEDGDE